MSNQIVKLVKLDKIVPDPDQPRKYFNVVKMKSLKESVKKYGIIEPLVLEEVDGQYIIEDGERRFKTAKDLKLKEVPAIIVESTGSVDRMIRRFHVQEHRESWSATEKASAVYELAKELKIPPSQIATVLGLDAHQVKKYLAFFNLIDKKHFEQFEIPLEYAEKIQETRNLVKKIYRDDLEEEFPSLMEKKLEQAIISRIKDGEFKKPQELTKIKDSFRKEPKSIKQFIETAVTPDALFIKTKAKPTYHLRNLMTNCHYINNHIKRFMDNPDAKLSSVNISDLELTKKNIETLLNFVK